MSGKNWEVEDIKNSAVRRRNAELFRELEAPRASTQKPNLAPVTLQTVEYVLAEPERLKTSLRLYLPFPQSVNDLYSTVRNRRVLSAKGRAYHKEVCAIVLAEGKNVKLTGRVSYALVLYPPDKRRRDLSNYVKVLEDSLTQANFWADDSQVCAFRVEWGEVRARGAAYIKIWSVDV